MNRRLPRFRFALFGDVGGDSVAIIVTSMLTAGTGVVFWIVAARTIEPHELGMQTALLSLMTTAGAVAASGPANALTAMIPTSGGRARRRLLRHSVTMTTVGSAVTGTVAGLVAVATMDGSLPLGMIAVAAGAVVMALFAVKDAMLTALAQARRLPLLNLASSLLKIALLPVLGVLAFPDQAVVATLLSAALTIGAATILVHRSTDRDLPDRTRARDHGLRSLSVFAVRDSAAGVILMGPLLAAPFLVTWLAGPVEGAALALMLPISQGLDFVSIGTATALTKHLPRADDPVRMVRRMSGLVLWTVLGVAVLVLIVLAPIMFRFFGDGYDHRILWTTLALLCLGSFCRTGFTIWAAVLRASLATRKLLVVNIIASVFSLPALVLCTGAWGARGAAAGLAIGSAVLGTIGWWGLRSNRSASSSATRTPSSLTSG